MVNASVCWKHVIAGPVTSLWSGAITTNLSSAVTGVALGQASTSYTYRLDCYNDAGSASAETTVTTNAGNITPPPPLGCPDPQWQSNLSDYGFTQQSTPNIWTQLQGSANFPTSSISSNTITVPKSTASGLVFLGANRGQYISVAFTTPSGTASGDLSFNASQVPGTNYTNLGSYYITISKCPGDFRYAITSPQNTTEFQACKSIRKAASGFSSAVESIRWNLSGVSGDGFTNNTCGLEPNTAYYINYANVNPDDGFVTSEHECPNNVSNCGVQFKSN